MWVVLGLAAVLILTASSDLKFLIHRNFCVQAQKILDFLPAFALLLIFPAEIFFALLDTAFMGRKLCNKFFQQKFF